MTPRGLAALRAELVELTAELTHARSAETASEQERTRAAAALSERLAELEARIECAELVSPAEQPPGEVRFGARVTVRSPAGALRTFQLVGVDEANASEGRIAFVAPLARALLGKRTGEAALVRTPQGEEELELVRFEYDPPGPDSR